MRSALVTVLLLLALVACRSDEPRSRAVPARDAAELLVDRNWLDHWPEARDDRMHVVRFVPSMGGGVFQDRTIFHGEFELFVFHVDGAELEIDLPHTDEHIHTGFRIERVAGPEPFDLRLTLERNPRGPRVYYGRSSEHGGVAELDASLAAMVKR